VHHTQNVRAEALTDGLTGARNRRALDVTVAELGDAFAAVMVDTSITASRSTTRGCSGSML
jgi:GGDEF domain-containing protein